MEGSKWVYRLNKIGHTLIITKASLMDSFYSFCFCAFASFIIEYFKKHFIKNGIWKQGMVVHACNPSIWEAETGESGFTASLSYLVRSSEAWQDPVSKLKNKKLG